MAYVALTSLMETLKLEFLQATPRLTLNDVDQPPIKSFFQNISSLRQFLDIFQFGRAPCRDLETKIRDFALEAEDNIETQISNFLLAKGRTAHPEEAYQQLRLTLREAAENAAELLNITNVEKDGETQRKMSCDALTSLIGKFRSDFSALGEDIENLPAVIESLIENLSSLHQFLEISNFHNFAVKYMAAKIRVFAFREEGDINQHLREIRFFNETSITVNPFQEFRQTLQKVAENTAELLNSINNITQEADEANQTQPPPIPWLKHNASQSVNVNVKGGDNGSSSLRCFEDTMVGRLNDVTTIKDQLLWHFDGLQVIPIIGMLGIGKTTLARRIFEDQLVTQHFEVKIWFTVPHKYNKIQILRDLLQSITQVEQYEIKDGRAVSEMVRECLKHRRYLIVLDDIWSTQHWDDIEFCFPRNGSILLITRSHEVADHACTKFIYHGVMSLHPDDRGWDLFPCSSKGPLVMSLLDPDYESWDLLPCSSKGHHVMSLLDPNESWDLFCNIFPLERFRAPRFKSFRSHLSNVVEKCDGLPQAIVILAERLSKCNSNIRHELKKIEKEIELLGILDYSALTLIYNQLPEHLKVCFLYLGVFPKRSEIRVKTLLRLWIAEGFVKPSKKEELEKIAYCYLKGLIDRSLVLISRRTFDGKIKTCRVHSVMHNICFREAQKEGILCAVNTQKLPRWSLNAFTNSCRWFSLCKHSFDYYVLFSLNNPRSVFFFQDNSEILVPFKLLRVLASVPSPFLQRVPMHLGDLVFLRYLSITQWFEGLNNVVSTNLNLQTLVVCGSDGESQLGVPTLHLPSTIWESPQLRHLELGTLYTVDPPSVVKKNLQTLSWVGQTHCRKEVYSNFPNIKKLKIFCKEDLEPSHIGGSSSKDIILDNLDYLVQLKSLTISVSVGCIVTFPERCPFPSQLKKLSLSGTNISGWDLTVIGSLQCLEVLKLENAFHEEVWRVAEGGFYGLKLLLLEAKKLRRLEACPNAFPFLKHLILRCCHYLEEIPNSFGKKCFLESIELDSCCCPSIVTFVKDIQEKQNKEYSKANFEIKIHGPKYDESGYIVECGEDVGVDNFEKANSEIKKEAEYDESGHIVVECVEDVGVGKFEKTNFEEGEYDESGCVEDAGVGKLKSYIPKIKKKRYC
ncbi:putative late blight resistance protein homolog R1C-3 [Ipomoea triloba]|uniref:putative late blight resistance protein homolog R1C-3 n=1 Tax=Ipomoea triloba TaxID=35885 RepID=UPI00125E199E|nr:putative late blight resistance protein homolog R1C-3 [Ipomoea triloba]XP_031098871.1 putative late blight resistance protein homolog R1C-3 [Ipomoea triloba]XP_031098872.1 putative late blight resistance protein homolog R1C-3 [Ipomoea triloba]XP_031098873.1 putative late blight resistance protein homolog R1C-3 [Ipomoea triloba]XP_031098874.1 putative late blight resistance protein homolog R1C-3 [Ipomoea triloba]XP_031098875.1 putative late blight resistance protein homolog R1C-3 [Ipomoea tr